MKRLEDCGRASYGSIVTLRRNDEGQSGVAGVVSCGSVHVCSVCSAKIASRRQDELQRGLTNWWRAGGHVAMLTLTMRHTVDDPLAGLWDQLGKAWAGVTSGRQWIRDRAEAGIAGYMRVVELTQSPDTGWHVHIHALLFLSTPEFLGGFVDDYEPDLRHLEQSIVGRWVNKLDKLGASATAAGQRLELVTPGSTALADYFTKSVDNGDATELGAHSVSMEMNWGQEKRARKAGGRSPFGILDAFIATGDADELALWQEYAYASKGRRQMTWGAGTRDLLGLAEEQTDEQIADEELGTKEDDALALTAAEWWHLSADGAIVAAVLHELAAVGVESCEALLYDLGYKPVRVDLTREGQTA